MSQAIHLTTILSVGLVYLALATFLRRQKKKSYTYLFFLTIFAVYVYKVFDYTLLQFQSLLLLQHFVPNLMLHGVQAGRAINLIPLATLRLEDVQTSLLNILMMMPWGFGLPFVTKFRFSSVVKSGLGLSLAIELLQFLTGFLANTTFRVADINDLIFNTVGVAIGYLLFIVFIRIYRHFLSDWAQPISRYIVERPQVS